MSFRGRAAILPQQGERGPDRFLNQLWSRLFSMLLIVGFIGILVGSLPGQELHKDHVLGDLELVEGSMRLEYTGYTNGNHRFFCSARLVNKTNAVVQWVRGTLILFRTDGKKMWSEVWVNEPVDQELAPGETLPFHLDFSVPPEAVGRGGIPTPLKYSTVFWFWPVRWVNPTSVASTSWGRLKGAVK